MQSHRISDADYQAAVTAYHGLNDSPMQRRLREEKKWFVGAVYWNPADYDKSALETEFKLMRDTGLNLVRFHSVQPVEIAPGQFDFTRADDWLDAAHAAGLYVVLALNWSPPSDAILEQYDLTRQQFRERTFDDKRLQSALAAHVVPIVEHFRDHPALLIWGGFGEPDANTGELSDFDKQGFADWLREKYGTVEALDTAWSFYPRSGHTITPTFEDAWRIVLGMSPSFNFTTPDGSITRSYGGRRDLTRYFTEKSLARDKYTMDLIRQHDPDHIITSGSHQLLSNNAHMRWDIPARARLGDLHYCSLHLPWHFEHVGGEIDRPVYMQARITRDYLKHGWTSCYETTGGSVQYSGGYGHTMTTGLMRRMTLSYLAASNLNIAFWTWNHRPGGWEAGEYSMITYSGEVSEWGLEAGKIGRGMEQFAAELWEADNEPHVGIVHNWDNEAILMQEPERHELRDAGPHDYSSGTRQQASRAQIGTARALINAHVPYEIVTAQELMEGIAAYYPVLYVPHMRAISSECIDQLHTYVERGGHLIADVQFAFLDEWGKMHHRVEGESPLKSLFGAWFEMIHDARNLDLQVDGIPVTGFHADIALDGAKVLKRFNDGRAAVTEYALGTGKATLIAFDAGIECFKPGNAPMESLLTDLIMDNAPRNWACSAPMAYRLTMPEADHYFLFNDGPVQMVTLRVYDHAYSEGVEVMDGVSVDVSGTIAIPIEAESAVWVRFKRQP